MRPGPAGRNPKRSRLRRRRLPGPAPAGGPTSCAPKKSAEEGRSRGARLKKMGAQSSPPLRIPPPLTFSQPRVEGRCHCAQQSGYRKARPWTHGGKQRPFRAFARSARVRGVAAQFSASPWALRATQSGRASPEAPPVRFRRLAGRGIAPVARRRAGCCRLVRSSVTGRRRLWPQADRRRRGGRRDLAAGHPCRESGPQGRVREADSSRGRGAERPRAAVARSALRAQPGQAA